MFSTRLMESTSGNLSMVDADVCVCDSYSRVRVNFCNSGREKKKKPPNLGGIKKERDSKKGLWSNKNWAGGIRIGSSAKIAMHDTPLRFFSFCSCSSVRFCWTRELLVAVLVCVRGWVGLELVVELQLDFPPWPVG